jgi:hypothetical protein
MMSYPYGWLELTVSGAWTILARPGHAATSIRARKQENRVDLWTDHTVRAGVCCSMTAPSPHGPVKPRRVHGQVFTRRHFLREAKNGGFSFPEEVLTAG